MPPIPATVGSASARGTVYTPRPLAAFTVDRALEHHARDSSNKRWLDPACGDGVFLEEAVKRLALTTPPDALPAVVRERVFGIDIDPEACSRARDRLVAAVEAVAGPQERGVFTSNVRCMDFLDAQPTDLGWFDLIVANPPYVSTAHLTAAEKTKLAARFATAWGRFDLYGIFFEQALHVLAPRGTIAFLTPDKYLVAESARRLRAFLATRLDVRSVDRFDRHDLFPGVATVPTVTVASRKPGPGPVPACPVQRWWDIAGDGAPVEREGQPVRLDVALDGAPWTGPVVTRDRGHRAGTVPLSSLVRRISVGIATGLNRCFVMSAEDATARGIEDSATRDAVRGRDIGRGEIRASATLKLVFPYVFRPGCSPALMDLDEVPGLAAWLKRHRQSLEERHCVRVWKKRWYDLHDPVTSDLAAKPKILVPDLARGSRFCYDSGRYVPLHSAYYLELRGDAQFDPEVLVALLNSPAIEAELLERAPIAKSGYRRFRAQFLRDLPIPRLTPLEQARLFDEHDRALLHECASWAIDRDAA